jgi:hypothetical protein
MVKVRLLRILKVEVVFKSALLICESLQSLVDHPTYSSFDTGKFMLYLLADSYQDDTS